MDIIEFINQLPLSQKLLLASFGFLFLDTVLSIVRYKKRDERLSLMIRHLAGLIVGITDQYIMIIYGWQADWVWQFIIWCYSVYTFFLLLMPNFLVFERKKAIILLIVWLFGIGTLASFIEMSTWLSMYGYLPYPTEPIVWLPIHTWIFYIGVYTEGTFIVLFGCRLEDKYRKNNED